MADALCEICGGIVASQVAELTEVRFRRTLCPVHFNQAKSGKRDAAALPDNTWPIVDEESLKRAIRLYEKQLAAEAEDPDNIIAERMPLIAEHITNRAFELNLQDVVPGEIVDRVFRDWASRRMYQHWDAIEQLAHQLAFEARSSRDAGAG